MATTLLELSKAKLVPANWSDGILIVIDAQNEYTSGKLPLAGVDRAITEVARLLRAARQAKAPVIHVVQHSPVGRGLFEVGSRTAAIIDGLGPLDDETVVSKALPNAFAGTSLYGSLEAIRHKTGRTKLILAGFMTHMCVSATARSALDHGFPATVVASATATRDLPDPLGGVIPAHVVHATALAELADRFAAVVPQASLIDVGHPAEAATS